MPDNDSQAADRIRQFEQYLNNRVEEFTHRLDKADWSMRGILKTERAEAATIHAAFRGLFASWL
jgi:hypothetical protein